MNQESPYRPDPPRYPREVSAAEIREVIEAVRAGQRLGPAAAVGLAVAVVGALAVVTGLEALGWTDWRLLCWACVSLAAMVGLCVRILGRGVQPVFALVGALLGLVTPVVGELYAIVLTQRWTVAQVAIHRPEISAFIETRGGWDWVLFLISALIAAKLAGKSVTSEDVRRRLRLRPKSETDKVVDSFMRWNSDL